jgi:hypothetical protein
MSSSSSSSKSIRVDRDDFDADHYADFMRDIHRSRLTLDQLDIAKRQLRKKEKLITRTHDLKMKEHTRVKNEFIRKIQQDLYISNLPSVKETLKNQRRKRLGPSLSLNSNEHPQEAKSHQLDNHSKRMRRPQSPRTERLKANLDKFNHTNKLLD